MSQSGSTHTCGGCGAVKVTAPAKSDTLSLHDALPILMANCCSGKHITSGLLTVRKAGETPLEYIKITSEDVCASVTTTGGIAAEDWLTENLTLNFARVKVDYQEQKPDGSGTPAGNMGW